MNKENIRRSEIANISCSDWMRFSIWGVVSPIGQSTKDEPDILLIRVWDACVFSLDNVL
jgi:hypothetical protein